MKISQWLSETDGAPTDGEERRRRTCASEDVGLKPVVSIDSGAAPFAAASSLPLQFLRCRLKGPTDRHRHPILRQRRRHGRAEKDWRVTDEPIPQGRRRVLVRHAPRWAASRVLVEGLCQRLVALSIHRLASWETESLRNASEEPDVYVGGSYSWQIRMFFRKLS